MKTIIWSILGIYLFSGCALNDTSNTLSMNQKTKNPSQITIWIPRQ